MSDRAAASTVTSGRRELIHPRCRTAFRDVCSDWSVVAQIERAFADEGFEPAGDEELAIGTMGWYASGQRRGTFDRCTYHVDWSDAAQVRRVLNVFEQILSWVDVDHADRGRLIRHLERDGLRVDEHGRIRAAATATLAELPIANLTDPAALLEHLDRIVETADRDPAVAISGARALIEATTKLVLHELGEPVDEKAGVPSLVKQAQTALGLHADALAPTAKGAETIKRIFSGLTQIAVGVAELRNLYGPDHGRSAPTTGLGPRHAHLAVGAASVYCRAILETLAARQRTQPTP